MEYKMEEQLNTMQYNMEAEVYLFYKLPFKVLYLENFPLHFYLGLTI